MTTSVCFYVLWLALSFTSISWSHVVKHTDVGVELGVVKVLNDGLEILLGPVPGNRGLFG